jgi:DNA-binding NarL/FixJ family response regulator
MIRLVLVDDQTLVRKGIRGLLETTEAIRVVAEAADGEEAVRAITEAAPDLVLLDVRMPRQNGVEVLTDRRLVGRLPPTIILTTFDAFDDRARNRATDSRADQWRRRIHTPWRAGRHPLTAHPGLLQMEGWDAQVRSRPSG